MVPNETRCNWVVHAAIGGALQSSNDVLQRLSYEDLAIVYLVPYGS
jgi:hypothetical protein